MDTAPHPFTLRQLQYAVAVGQTLSFRRAAERCHVSQPSLSAQIAALESGLGVRLFERDRRRVLVTGAGRELLERARSILSDADDVVSLARGAADPLAGTLRVGVIPTLSPYLLPRLAQPLRAAHPRLTLRWVEEKTDVLASRLRAGQLDGAVLALEAEIGEVESETIGFDPFVLATARDHPLAASTAAVDVAQLRDVDVLLLDDGHCFREQALAVCSRASARELEFRATSLPTLVQMVAAGAGVTLLPTLAVDVEAARADLRVRPFAAPQPGRTIALVWRRRSALGPALRQIASTLRAAWDPTARSTRSRAKVRGKGAR